MSTPPNDQVVEAQDAPTARPHSRHSRSVVWIVSLAGLALVPATVAADGELESFLLCGWEMAPLAALGVLAHHGVERRGARLAARVVALLLVLAMLVVDLVVVGGALGEWSGDGTFRWVASEGRQLARVMAGGMIVLGACLLTWRLSRTSDEGSELRRLALTTVVGLTGLAVVPLVVLGEPPLLLWFQHSLEAGVDPFNGRGTAGLLRDQLYGLCWTLPAAFFAVGYGVRRDLTATLHRLGFAWPSRRHVRAAAVITVALLAASWAWEEAIAGVWHRLGWPVTDLDTFDALFEFALSPLGAVIIGVAAGVGEEVSVRGVLQPSIGILRSNLLFTALHALQYNWDALLSVFLIGLVLGVTRRRTSTTVTAIVHGAYDFVLVMAVFVERSTG